MVFSDPATLQRLIIYLSVEPIQSALRRANERVFGVKEDDATGIYRIDDATGI